MLKKIYRPLSSLGFLVLIGIFGLLFTPSWSSINQWRLTSWPQVQQSQQVAGLGAELNTVDRVTTLSLSELPKEQAELTVWLSKKYRVAQEPIRVIVAQAFKTGHQLQLQPTLILAVMAIESGFNPFAQSSVGAQGLMQVMTDIHTDKYENFGGKLAAFDPVSNLQVGAKILLDCITKAGSIVGGLKHYVGTPMGNDGGYSDKVLLEQQRLDSIILERSKVRVALAAS